MQSPNQFSQSVQKGQIDLNNSNSPLPCQVDAAESGSLVPGQAVKLATTAGGVPKILAATVDTGKIFGYVAYNTKKSSFSALDHLEIVRGGGIIYLEASAAVVRGASVMNVITGEKVATATTGKAIAGMALDTASASGDLIRVEVGYINSGAVA